MFPTHSLQTSFYISDMCPNVWFMVEKRLNLAQLCWKKHCELQWERYETTQEIILFRWYISMCCVTQQPVSDGWRGKFSWDDDAINYVLTLFSRYSWQSKKLTTKYMPSKFYKKLLSWNGTRSSISWLKEMCCWKMWYTLFLLVSIIPSKQRTSFTLC